MKYFLMIWLLVFASLLTACSTKPAEKCTPVVYNYGYSCQETGTFCKDLECIN
jgi:hypothetical protein